MTRLRKTFTRPLHASAVAILYGALTTALSVLLAYNLESQLRSRGLRSESDLDLLELFFLEGPINPITKTLLFSLVALALINPLADASLLLTLRSQNPNITAALYRAPRYYLRSLARALNPAGALLLLALGLSALPYATFALTEHLASDIIRLRWTALAASPALLILSLYPASVDRARIDLVEYREQSLQTSLRDIALFTPIGLAFLALRLILIQSAPAGIPALFLFGAFASLIRAISLGLHRAFALRARGL